jgi:anhydro-N-acetylmuramic acid kinase
MKAGARNRGMDPSVRPQPWVALRDALEREGACVAGVLSGTSGDGIGVVVAKIRSSGAAIETPCIQACETIAFSTPIEKRVRAVLDGKPMGLRECALLDRDLGREFGSAARDVARRAGLELDLVGSHGQTVWHHDGIDADGSATLQLGDGDFAAETAGCCVVSDFRRRDIAAGGEGAPLSALADGSIFAAVPRPCAILNLGGMGNLTVLGRDPEEILAFDTGPANSLLDGIARRFLDRPYDAGGACAARGYADERLVRELSMHPFLAKKPPRSTGRDTFGQEWVETVTERARKLGILATADGVGDLMASAVDFVALCVARSLTEFVPTKLESIVVAGGGARNQSLMAALERRTGARMIPSDEYGVPIEAREGLVFAVLAARCVLSIPSTHPGATGAARGRVLGKISQTTTSAASHHRDMDPM